MSLVEYDNVIQTFSPDRADDALAKRILPWGARCGDDFLEAHVADALLKNVTVDAIAITDQVAWRRILRKRFDDLLGRPFSRRMRSDVEVDDAPV